MDDRVATAVSVTIAVDVGQSGARVRLTRPEGSIDTSAAGHQPDRSVTETVGRVLAHAAGVWGRDLEASCLVLGLTGLHGHRPDAATLRTALPPGWSIGELRAVDDSIAAYRCGLGDRPGVVIAVGTGVTATAWDGLETWVHGDGRGPLLGDRGGGYWIGRRALRHVVRQLDGGPSTALLELAAIRYGDLSRIHETLRFEASSVARIATFCPDVLEAARLADPIALAVVGDAVDALQATTVQTARRAGLGGRPAGFAIVGGVSLGGDVLVGPWRGAVSAAEPQLTWQPTSRVPIDALAELAVGPIPGGFESVVSCA